jgi:hypothetical protein
VAATLRHDRGNVYLLELTGRLHAADLEAVQQAAAGQIRGGGKIRLLVLLHTFEGWDPAATGLAFYIKHGEDIERIAIVGDGRWRDEALMFAGADLRQAQVEFFLPPDGRWAAEWVAQ